MTATHRVILDGLPTQLPDADADETQEWLDSLDCVVDAVGPQRARYLVLRLVDRARQRQARRSASRSSPAAGTLRRSFVVDVGSLVVQVLARLAAVGQAEPRVVAEAAGRYRLDDPDFFPVGVSAGGDS